MRDKGGREFIGLFLVAILLRWVGGGFGGGGGGYGT